MREVFGCFWERDPNEAAFPVFSWPLMVCEFMRPGVFWCPACGHELTGLRTETKIWGTAGVKDGKSPHVS